MKHIGTVLLETERLILRKQIIEDLEYTFPMLQDLDVKKYYTPYPFETNFEREKRNVEQLLNQYKEPSFYRWIVERKEDNKIIGMICLVVRSQAGKILEMNYYLGKSYWRQGYGTEVGKRILDFGFNQIGCNRMEAFGAKVNSGTWKVMEKMGLKYEGERKEGYHYYYAGVQDIVLYGLTKKEYDDEYRDLYDNNGQRIDSIINKTEEIPKEYHCINVLVWIENSKGELLFQRRIKDENHKWSTTSGHLKSGEDSLTGIQKEVLEELGIYIDKNEFKFVYRDLTEKDIVDIYVVKQDIDLECIYPQIAEVKDIKWISIGDVKSSIKKNLIFEDHEPYFAKYLEDMENENE
jgi:Acetyltransferases, including N-acetylases of ribosomal proteins